MYRQNGEGSETRRTLHLPTTRQSRMYLNQGWDTTISIVSASLS